MRLYNKKAIIISFMILSVVIWMGYSDCQTVSEDTPKKSSDSLKVAGSEIQSDKPGKVKRESETDSLEKQIQSVVSQIQRKENALEEKEAELQKKEKRLHRMQWISWIFFGVGIVALGLTVGIIWFRQKSGKESKQTSSAKKKQ
ncbi:MAG: hypothetical protein R6V04_08945 [bacterium]